MVYSKLRNLEGLGIHFDGCCQLSNCVISIWLMIFCSFNSKRWNPARPSKCGQENSKLSDRGISNIKPNLIVCGLDPVCIILYGFHLVSIRLCRAKGGKSDLGKICLTDIL